MPVEDFPLYNREEVILSSFKVYVEISSLTDLIVVGFSVSNLEVLDFSVSNLAVALSSVSNLE